MRFDDDVLALGCQDQVLSHPRESLKLSINNCARVGRNHYGKDARKKRKTKKRKKKRNKKTKKNMARSHLRVGNTILPECDIQDTYGMRVPESRFHLVEQIIPKQVARVLEEASKKTKQKSTFAGFIECGRETRALI